MQQAPQGKVLFSTDHPPVEEQSGVSSSSGIALPGPPDSLPKVAVTDAERGGLSIDSYDLDLHLTPAAAREETRATLIIRNTSGVAVSRIPLQVSSTFRWQGFSLVGVAGLKPVAFTQSPIATDADHTGYAQEAIVSLPEPLAPGASVTLSVFYLGDVRQSAARLEVLGTPTDRADHTEWDEIAQTDDDSATALRGFGNVIWYPVAAPTAVLGDANKLFEVIGRQRLQESTAKMRLHLTVEYAGDPPVGVVFDGELQSLVASVDDKDELVGNAHGLATTEFPARPIGFRIPSLFLTAQQPTVTDGQMLSVITPHTENIPPYAEAAAKVQPLLTDWFGATPIEPLILLDHPGEPFEDHALVVGQLAGDARGDDVAPALVGGLSHAWFHSSHPWISEGLAQFMSLLWIERTAGRQAAMGELAHEANLIALTEPDFSLAVPTGGEALTEASSEVYFRSKAAAVWWQLRDILGEDVLRQGLAAYRKSVALNSSYDSDPKAMQKTLEKVSHRELGWFFEDWVYRDRGLPDLAVVAVNPRLLPARPGKNSGYLVAVEVRNDGDAVAEVPVTVHSGRLTSTERLRIPGHGTSSTRILFEDTPETLQVNDGSTPELRTSIHNREITVTH